MIKCLVALYAIIGSVIFSFLMMTLTFVYSFFCLFCYKLPYKVRYGVINLWTWAITSCLTIFCGICYRVEGRENIPKTNAIIFSKHQSTWETFILPMIFPHPAIIIKKELLNIPFFGWGLRLLDPIAINRKDKSSAMDQIVALGKARLAKGDWILVFPEGTRIAPGEKSKYKIGGGVLAEKTGYPVVPVALNSGEYWPKRSFLKKPGRITVAIGPAIETKGRLAADIMKEAQTWIENKMQEISRPQKKRSK